jgi:hypothetical protein
VAYATGPFVLLTISGIPLGFALRFGLRRLSSVPDPLRVRRRRGTVVPLALAVTVALAGAAAIVDDGVAAILRWWPWAIALPLGTGLLVWMALGLPRWWRLLAPLGVAILFIAPAFLAWSRIEPGEGGLPLTRESRGLLVPAMVRTGEESDTGVVVAMVRVVPDPVGESGALSLRVLPAVPLTAVSGSGAGDGVEPADRPEPSDPPDPSGEPSPEERRGVSDLFASLPVATDARVTVTLALEEYIPPLWWFPRGPRVAAVTFRVGTDGIHLRRPPSPIGGMDLGADAPGEALHLREEASIDWPGERGRFLQPGVYVLEYRRE